MKKVIYGLKQQNSNRGQVDESKKRNIQLVISGGNSTKPFELLEEALDQMAFFIQPPVYWPRMGNIALRRHHIAGSML